MTVHNWGESPIGSWILRVETREPQNKKSMKSASKHGDTGELIHFGLRIYGSSDLDGQNTGEMSQRSKQSYAFVPTSDEITSIYKHELAAREAPKIMQKRAYENLIKRKQVRKKNENESPIDKSLFGIFRRTFNF